MKVSSHAGKSDSPSFSSSTAHGSDGLLSADEKERQVPGKSLHMLLVLLWFKDADMEGKYLSEVSEWRWPILVLIFAFDMCIWILRTAWNVFQLWSSHRSTCTFDPAAYDATTLEELDAACSGFSLQAQTAGFLQVSLPQIANLIILHGVICGMNVRSRRSGHWAARQEEWMLSALIALAISNLVLGLTPENSKDYVYASFLIICSASYLKIRWWLAMTSLALPTGLALVQNKRHIFSSDEKQHITIAWLAGGLMAWLAESYRRRTFAGQQLAQFAHEKEVQEASRRLAIQEQLAIAREEAAQRALVVMREKAANEAKSEFMSLMCHEVRTPLNGCLASAEMLLETPLLEEQRELTNTIRISGSILLSTVSNFLDFFKVQAGKKLDIVRAPFNVMDLIKDVHCIVEAMVGQQSSVVLLPPETDCVHTSVLGDPDRLKGVLLNLYSNAAKFTRSGFICVRVRRRLAADVAADNIINQEVSYKSSIRALRHLRREKGDAGAAKLPLSPPRDSATADGSQTPKSDGATKRSRSITNKPVPQNWWDYVDTEEKEARWQPSWDSWLSCHPKSRHTRTATLQQHSAPQSASSARSASTRSRSSSGTGKESSVDAKSDSSGSLAAPAALGSGPTRPGPLPSASQVLSEASGSSNRTAMDARTGHVLVIEVVDTGIGISHEGRKSLFAQFSQVNSDEVEQPRQFSGTGLGLSICARQMNVLGGSIGAKSNPGYGSIFWLSVPIEGELAHVDHEKTWHPRRAQHEPLYYESQAEGGRGRQRTAPGAVQTRSESELQRLATATPPPPPTPLPAHAERGPRDGGPSSSGHQPHCLPSRLLSSDISSTRQLGTSPTEHPLAEHAHGQGPLAVPGLPGPSAAVMVPPLHLRNVDPVPVPIWQTPEDSRLPSASAHVVTPLQARAYSGWVGPSDRSQSQDSFLQQGVSASVTHLSDTLDQTMRALPSLSAHAHTHVPRSDPVQRSRPGTAPQAAAVQVSPSARGHSALTGHPAGPGAPSCASEHSCGSSYGVTTQPGGPLSQHPQPLPPPSGPCTTCGCYAYPSHAPHPHEQAYYSPVPMWQSPWPLTPGWGPPHMPHAAAMYASPMHMRPPGEAYPVAPVPHVHDAAAYAWVHSHAPPPAPFDSANTPRQQSRMADLGGGYYSGRPPPHPPTAHAYAPPYTVGCAPASPPWCQHIPVTYDASPRLPYRNVPSFERTHSSAAGEASGRGEGSGSVLAPQGSRGRSSYGLDRGHPRGLAAGGSDTVHSTPRSLDHRDSGTGAVASHGPEAPAASHHAHYAAHAAVSHHGGADDGVSAPSAATPLPSPGRCGVRDGTDHRERTRDNLLAYAAACESSANTLGPRQISSQGLMRDDNPADFKPSIEGVRVLLAEDNLINQMVAKKMLAAMGAHVSVVNNGLEAVDRVKAVMAAAGMYPSDAVSDEAADDAGPDSPIPAGEAEAVEPIDVILMDMAMPEMDGVSATVAIRKLGNELPIVAMTANITSEDQALCRKAGMNGFLSKPILKGRLRHALHKVLNGVNIFPRSSDSDGDAQGGSEPA